MAEPIIRPEPIRRHYWFIPYGKPHLYLSRGIWCCKASPFGMTIGHGYTPLEAYRDYIDQVLHPIAA
jgi:hypothetical protein